MVEAAGGMGSKFDGSGPEIRYRDGGRGTVEQGRVDMRHTAEIEVVNKKNRPRFAEEVVERGRRNWPEHWRHSYNHNYCRRIAGG